MLNVLDLFSGVGNFSLGLRRSGGFRTRAFCEIDRTCHPVLNRHFPGVPVLGDVTEVRADDLGFHPDAICGGFPCQDLSVNGRAAGLDGERSGLWFQYLRIIGETNPSWVIVENVSALRSRGLEEVLRGLSALGYSARWDCIPANAFGAAHQRDRVWVVANRSSERVQGLWAEGLEKSLALVEPFLPLRDRDGQWEVEPDVRRTAYGNASRLDGRMSTWGQRLHQIGNAVVPQVPEAIGREILRVEGLQ
jgi:DNA (cytosine-5)-methyltransferase 1